MKLIHILIVDDHRIVREGLRAMLSTQSDLQVVGEAATGKEAITHIERLQPDIVLLDLEMPLLDGVGVLEYTRTHFPALRSIILTAYGSDEHILEAVRAGAKGYLLKGAGLDEVLHAVRTVAAGGSLLEPKIAERLLGSVEHLLRHEKVPDALTERECAILVHIAHGLSNKAIGEEMHLAERTIKFYVTIIFQKLSVTNRAEAAAKALNERLITL